MTSSEWIAEVCKRLGINEGRRNVMYHDSLGIPTIGIGFNLQRDDAARALTLAGASLSDVMAGGTLTNDQVDDLFEYSFRPIIQQARGSLYIYSFDALSDARRFVICDLVYNMGLATWMSFSGTREIIAQATHLTGDAAHARYGQAADHLENSAWYSQVGDRAKRNVAMMRSSNWVDANGNGSDAS